ncbi:hypothetical protein [Puniceicoccus vermicola]|uniref:Uncharacterized protein n=1 Tax=Puniceicoccus vermicola TaxID=388746 RepID=A0A7X1B2A9_9BACT|nr:hypothetical protein [Puniceicoccus vermicola]MBC2604319.1 hypothetical protein [Puniceicoccus vermicola]
MMRTYYFISIFFFFYQSGMLVVRAQDVASREFRVVTSASTITNSLKYDFAGEQKTIRVGRSLSSPFPLPDGDLEIYREVFVEGEDEPIREIVAEVQVPESLSNVILFVLKDGRGGYRVYPFDDDYDIHKSGYLRLFNMSHLSAAINLNKTVVVVDPGDFEVIPFSSGPTMVKVAIQGGRDWKIIFNRGSIARPGMRAYIFVFDFEKDTYYNVDIPPAPALVRMYSEKVPEYILDEG